MKHVEKFWKLNTWVGKCGFYIMNSLYVLYAERKQKVPKVTFIVFKI
jgi:hypothetical protein